MNTILPISNNTQINTFLFSILVGIFIPLMYDIFRIKRRIIRTRILFIHMEDVLFWILTAILVFLHIYYFNDGEFRFYIFLGLLIGTIFYIAVISKTLIKSFVLILNYLCRVTKYIITILLYPIRIIYKIVALPIKMVYNSIKQDRTD